MRRRTGFVKTAGPTFGLNLIEIDYCSRQLTNVNNLNCPFATLCPLPAVIVDGTQKGVTPIQPQFVPDFAFFKDVCTRCLTRLDNQRPARTTCGLECKRRYNPR